MRRWATVASLLLAAAGPAAAPAADEGGPYVGFFATGVVDYSPGPGFEGWYDLPDRALGPPRGGGEQMGSTDVVTLGLGGSLTLSFDDPNGRPRVIADGDGPDLIIAENPMVSPFTGGTFVELVRVQVSSDGVHFAEFPTLCEQTWPVTPDAWFNTVDPSLYHGFAGVRPVLYDANSTGPAGQRDPFDPASAGGDAFDLADLADVPEVLDGLVDPNAIRYVRLVDVNGDGSETDSFGNPVYDPAGVMDSWPDDPTAVRPLSADIDAVTVIHGLYGALPEPVAGDADGDGRVDYRDYLLVKANLGRAGEAGDLTGDGRVDGADLAVLAANFPAPDGPGPAVPEPAAGALWAAVAAVGLHRRRRAGRR